MYRSFCLLPLIALPAHAEGLRVVTDIGPVHSLVAMVAGDAAQVSTLLEAGASPHDLALRPSQARDLAGADLVVWVGPALSPELEDTLQTVTDGVPQLVLQEVTGLTQLEGREAADFLAAGLAEESDGHSGDDHGHSMDDHGHSKEAHGHSEDDHGHAEDDHGHSEEAHGHSEDDHGHSGDDHGHSEEAHGHSGDDHGHSEEAHGHSKDDHGHIEDDHGHDHGHAHGGVDPHFWLSPDNAKLWVTAIVQELTRLNPDHSEKYQNNAENALALIAAAEAEAAATLAPIAGQTFVVYHDAYRYFEDSFDLSVIGAISNSDAAASGPASLAALRDRISERNPACLLAEPGFNPGLIAAVGASDLPLAQIDPLGSDIDAGAGQYPALIVSIAEQIATCAASG